jgi:starvation-inducible DNA-binding protein
MPLKRAYGVAADADGCRYRAELGELPYSPSFSAAAMPTSAEGERKMIERLGQRLAADALQRQLRDLLCLAVVGDHLRWAVTGDEAVELAEWLTAAVPRWRALADQVAKHMVSLGVAPDGRVRSLAKGIPLSWVLECWLRVDEAQRLLADRLRIVASANRQRRSQAADRDTMQLLDAICTGLEPSP